MSRLAIGVLVAIVAACALLLALAPPGTESEDEIALPPPFEKRVGTVYAGRVELPPQLAWNRPRFPPLVLHEDGVKLSPKRDTGAKQIGPSTAEVVFRASDDSDPNANGKRYSLRFVRPLVPLPAYLGAVLVGLTALFLCVVLAVERAALRPALRRSAMIASSLFYGVALVESISAVLLADRLAVSTLKAVYENALAGKVAGMFRSSTANFTGHPYLNFVLNPDALYKNERQFDPRYHIRRKEPLRPRSEVAWRALALGGSTTYGQLIADEADTWVYRLEKLVRDAHGPDYDVVNGGVSGYNVVENLIHYILLLDELEPDVVVLYIGINDVHARLTGDLVRDYSNSRIPWRAEENTLPLADPRWTRSVTYRYLLLRRIERIRLGHIFDFVQRPHDPGPQQEDALRRNGPQIFASHLRNLVRLVLAQGRRAIIVPQIFIPIGRQDRTFARGVRENNEAAGAVARELGVPFLADLPSAFTREDVADNCHLNIDGSAKMARMLLPHLDPTRSPAAGKARPIGAR